MSPDPAADLARLRGVALALPAAAEKLSHGMPCFFLGPKGRSFAWFWHDHHGDDRTAVLVKTSGVDEQDVLESADPATYFRPPYLGPSGWIGIRVDGAAPDWDHVADRVQASWRMVAPRKLLDQADR